MLENRRIYRGRGSQDCEIVRGIVDKLRELRNLKRGQAAEEDSNNQSENELGTHQVKNAPRKVHFTVDIERFQQLKTGQIVETQGELRIRRQSGQLM